MAFESNNFNVARKKVLPKSEFNVECKIGVEGEISKVWAVSADVTISNKEVLDGSVSYAGSIETCLLYMTDSGEVGTVHSSCPFTSKFEDSDIVVGQKVFIDVDIEDYSIDNVSSNEVTITFLIEQKGFVISNEEVKTIKNNQDNICCKEEEMRVVRLIGDASATIVDESNLITREPIKRLLLCESQVAVRDVEGGSNFVSISGEIVNRLLYLTESDKFETAYVYSSFKEELELEGVTRESSVEGMARVRFCDVKADVENTEKGGKVVISTPIDLCVVAYSEESESVIQDMYSTSNQLEIVTESFSMARPLAMELLEGKIDGSLTLGEDKPRVDKILFSGANSVNVTNVYIQDGNINVEGIAKTNVVYLNDETGSLNAVQIEVPFTLSDRTDLPESSSLLAIATLSDVDVVVKKGREFFYDAKVRVSLYPSDEEYSAVISDANIADEFGQKDYAMELVFGKEGQDLWDIAKANKVTESLIATQNPDVSFPLTEDKQIIIYYQRGQ